MGEDDAGGTPDAFKLGLNDGPAAGQSDQSPSNPQPATAPEEVAA